ncbi:MAG: sugar transferase [Lachnospirales bacterium]
MYLKIKRFLDFILSLVAIIIFSWLFIIISILIKAEDGGNIIFKQKRIGKNKKEFYIYKFRTMKTTTPKDIPTHLLENPESYITRIGKFLRKSSLDELPQLFNILFGQMSIVGPRPALWNQFDLIKERDKNGSNTITPGLTGWAQVNGRDELPIEVKASFDGEYVKKMSFLFDFKIIIMTVFSVFKAEGIKEGKNEDTNNRKK